MSLCSKFWHSLLCGALLSWLRVEQVGEGKNGERLVQVLNKSVCIQENTFCLNNLMIGHGDIYPNYLLKGSVYFDKNHAWASRVNVAYRPWKIMLSFISIFFSDVILICKHL